jgi:hypothetical protein
MITGHGSDNNECGEFCVTSHVFTVNHRQHTRTYSAAGTMWGCAVRAGDGSVPNEHGTFMYGRDGWCDGMNVEPEYIDVTNDVSVDDNHDDDDHDFVSKKNVITYRGLFNNTTPHPTSHPGTIKMSSWLVFV